MIKNLPLPLFSYRRRHQRREPRRHVDRHALLCHPPVRLRNQLDQRVQRDLEPRDVFQGRLGEVAVKSSEDRLVRDDADALALALDLDHGGLEPG